MFSGSEKNRGFGYVQFSLFEDAEKAVQNVKSLDGRKVFVTFANKKPKKKRGHPAKESGDDSDDEGTETKGI